MRGGGGVGGVGVGAVGVLPTKEAVAVVVVDVIPGSETSGLSGRWGVCGAGAGAGAGAEARAGRRCSLLSSACSRAASSLSKASATAASLAADTKSSETNFESEAVGSGLPRSPAIASIPSTPAKPQRERGEGVCWTGRSGKKYSSYGETDDKDKQHMLAPPLTGTSGLSAHTRSAFNSRGDSPSALRCGGSRLGPT
jgi:hypothetical protein